MNPESSNATFAHIYHAARKNVGVLRESITEVQDRRSPPGLASRHRIERALVGSALANPTDLVVGKILRDIPSFSFRSLAHQAIWQACLETSYLAPPPPTQRGLLLERVVQRIWIACKSPNVLPQTGIYAMVLAELFPSPAPIAALARQFLDLQDETNIRSQILQAAALYRAGEISTNVFLARMSAIRDPGFTDYKQATIRGLRARRLFPTLDFDQYSRELEKLSRPHGA